MMRKGFQSLRSEVRQTILAVVWLPVFLTAQGFVTGGDTIADGLFKFGLYGLDSVVIGYDAKTADSGAVGGRVIHVDQRSVIRGDIYTNYLYAPPSRNYDTIYGVVSVDGDLRLGDGIRAFQSVYVSGNVSLSNEDSIYGDLHVGGSMSIGYGNRFVGDVYMAEDSMMTSSNFHANYFGDPPVALVDPSSILRSYSHSAPQLHWNSAFSIPSEYAVVDYPIPSTTVTPSSLNCTVLMADWWNPSMCSSAISGVTLAPNGASVLPPGQYGDLMLNHESKIILGEGIYEFNSISMNGMGQHISIYQPNGDRTQILVQNHVDFTYQASVMPYDTVGNHGGTILLYAGGTDSLNIGQENAVWATLVAPNAPIKLTYSTRLYGQAFGKVVIAEQNFEGNDGKYIPFNPLLPKVGLVSSGDTLVDEGNGTGTKVFPITFQLSHVNGLAVTVYFHTALRTPPGVGKADAADLNLITLDSVTFPIGDTVYQYTGLLINRDDIYEADDYFDIVLDSTRNGRLDSVVANNTISLGIRNDDAPPSIQWSQASLTVAEGDTAKLQAVLSTKSFRTASDSVTAIGVSGTPNTEFTLLDSLLSILPGDTTDFTLLSSLADGMDEPDDTVYVTLGANPNNAVLGTLTTMQVIFQDKDPTTKLAGSMQTKFTVNEPANPGPLLIKIPVLLAQKSGWDISWGMKVVSSGSASLDFDYKVIRGSGLITAGNLSDTIEIQILADDLDEPDEEFMLVFDPSAGMTSHLDFSGKDTIQVTILNNDGPLLRDTSMVLTENPPVGTRVMRMVNIETLVDLSHVYKWTLLPSADASYFTLADTGVAGWGLYVLDSSVMDYEQRSTPFNLKVTICGSYHCDTAAIAISLSDVMEAPTILGDDTIYVMENTVPSTAVDTLFVSDNSGWGIRWRIQGGSGAANFVIDSISGVISVASGAELDYETNPVQALKVIVRNDAAYEDTLNVTVILLNELEYTHVNIDYAQVPLGQGYKNPDTVWINSDSLDVEWSYDSQDTAETIGFTKDGVFSFIRKYCNPHKDFCGSDTLIIRRNTQDPVIIWTYPVDTIPIPNYTVVMPPPEDGPIYINDPSFIFGGTVQYIDSLGKLKEIKFDVPTDYKEGEEILIPYEFTDPYGNRVADTLRVVLDTTPPDVDIINPKDGQKFYIYNIDVAWTVDGVVMDTLNRASLSVVGDNMIIRNYMDLAGNIGSDTVVVKLARKKGDISVALVNPMIKLDPEKVSEVGKEYPSRRNESFSLSVVNQTSLEEEEAAWGGVGDPNTTLYDPDRRIYQTDPHLGPTLRIEAKFQHVGGTNGEGVSRGGVLSDLLERLESEGISSSKALCGESMPDDPDEVPLWRNDLKVQIQIYDNLGQFVDQFQVALDSISADYLNDGGMAVFYFSWEPDKSDMRLKTVAGRSVGNGAYILRGQVTARSIYLWCAGDYERGESVTSTYSMLELFGYLRGE